MPDHASETRYAFGDGDLPARRLELVARVFAPSTTTFLAEFAGPSPALVVDLGCGPGHVTSYLCGAFARARVIGLDESDAYLQRARMIAPAATFLRHDVRRVPFPVAPADLLYCRFLLSHLAPAASVIDAWSSQARPGGRLLLEEVEDIETDTDVFRRYLAITQKVVRDQGGCLYIGPALEQAPFAGSWRKDVSRCTELPVKDVDAAGMFCLNLEWLRSLAAPGPAHDAEELQRELEDRWVSGRGQTLRWRLRQIVLIRR